MASATATDQFCKNFIDGEWVESKSTNVFERRNPADKNEVVARIPLSTREEALTIGRYYWYSQDKIARLGYAPKPARAAVANALAWLLSSTQLPRWIRETLCPLPEVRASRALIPRPL